MIVPTSGWWLRLSVPCFGRRGYRGLFYCVQKGEHPAGKLDRSGDCDKVIHRRHLHNRIFRQGRGWPRTGGMCENSSRHTAIQPRCGLYRDGRDARLFYRRHGFVGRHTGNMAQVINAEKLLPVKFVGQS